MEPAADSAPPRPVKWGDLGIRATVGVVLIIGGAIEIYLGGNAFKVLAVLVAGLVAREWFRIIGEPAWTYNCAAVVSGLIVTGAIWFPPPFQWVALVAAVLLAPFLMDHKRLSGVGFVYAVLPALALVWLRDQPHGFALVGWLVAAVVATDIGAYFAGRMIGGPKLAPRVSPNKTWAGLLGGMAAAALVGLLVFAFSDVFEPGTAMALSAVLAVVAQGGDLGESALKRRFGVKDSGTILPGHGGIMDRLDGLLAAAPVVALCVWLLQASGSA
jgi:phosphatidate cytidylyltransferase